MKICLLDDMSSISSSAVISVFKVNYFFIHFVCNNIGPLTAAPSERFCKYDATGQVKKYIHIFGSFQKIGKNCLVDGNWQVIELGSKFFY